MDIDLVVVFVSGNWVEAEMVACALEGHEIPALVTNSNVGRIFPQASLMDAVKVIVPFEHLSDATDLLQLAYRGGPPFIGGFLTIPMSLLALLVTWFLRLWRRRSPPEA